MYEPLNVGPALASNQLPGFGYDPSGNMTQNGGAQYTYDAESRLTSAGGVNYFYDGDGNRVEKSSGALYWGSGPLAESDLNGTNWTDYIFFNGKRVARIDPNGSLHYYLSDHLGSTSVVTDASGNIQSESDYYPYGGEMPITSGDTNHYKFTGKERDGESGLDNFGARYDASTLGRFMTADWSLKPVSVPYANFGNPQSLNLYSYAENNPTTVGDPDGHCTDPISCGAEGAGIGTLIEPGGGTAVGAFLGGVVGAGITYFAGKAIISAIHNATNASSGTTASTSSSATSSNSGSPARTSQDELPRDANGKPVPDAEASGAAHTQLGTRQSRSKPGTSYPQAREFDKNGRPVKDIDHTDHGRIDHANPHQHQYDPTTGKRLPAEPVKPSPPPPPSSPPPGSPLT